MLLSILFHRIRASPSVLPKYNELRETPVIVKIVGHAWPRAFNANAPTQSILLLGFPVGIGTVSQKQVFCSPPHSSPNKNKICSSSLFYSPFF